MLQRIQTVYLLISGILIASLFGLPSAEISKTTSELFVYNARGIYSAVEGNGLIYTGWPVAVFTAALTLMHLLIIFLYKKRSAQMRLIIFSILLEIGLVGVTYYFIAKGSNLLEADFKLQLPFAFPIIAAIVDYLAWRGIVKDEALIKSLDRIR